MDRSGGEHPRFVPGAVAGGRAENVRPLPIALLSPPMLPMPPISYAGTERVAAALLAELHARGHQVTSLAPGDSKVDTELVATGSLWAAKVYDPPAIEHSSDVVQGAVDEGVGESLGELGQTARDELTAGALATLMLGAWPEAGPSA